MLPRHIHNKHKVSPMKVFVLSGFDLTISPRENRGHVK